MCAWSEREHLRYLINDDNIFQKMLDMNGIVLDETGHVLEFCVWKSLGYQLDDAERRKLSFDVHHPDHHLQHLKKLTKIYLYGCTEVFGNIQHLHHFKRLIYLGLGGTKVDGDIWHL